MHVTAPCFMVFQSVASYKSGCEVETIQYIHPCLCSYEATSKSRQSMVTKKINVYIMTFLSTSYLAGGPNEGIKVATTANESNFKLNQ